MTCRILATLLPMAFFVSTAASQDSAKKQADAIQLVQHLMDVHVGFEQMVPSGMSIEAREISRKGKSGDDLVVQYHIFVKGVPPDTLFQEIQWPVSAEKPAVALGGISVGKEGILMCAGKTPEQCGDPKKPDDPIEFITMPRPGEPTRLAFLAQNTRIGNHTNADGSPIVRLNNEIISDLTRNSVMNIGVRRISGAGEKCQFELRRKPDGTESAASVA